MLYLTYDNTKHPDGAGSQLQRILSIYIIAKYYKIGYIHTKINHLDYQGLKCLEANKPDISQITMYNELFELESDIILSSDEVHEVKFITDTIINQNINTSKTVILKIVYGHLLIDSNPDILNFNIDLKWISKSISLPLNIAIHIRRGELFVVDSDRMLPNSYYISCMKSLKTILDNNNIPFTFHLYTEVATQPFDVTPSHHGILNRTSSTITIRPDDSHMDDFKEFDSIVYHINECPVETLVNLVNSDILLASRSSYSYVAAMLKKKGVILFHPFWHKLNKNWIPVYSNNDILNNADKIIAIIK
jgi:hypothetical protein